MSRGIPVPEHVARYTKAISSEGQGLDLFVSFLECCLWLLMAVDGSGSVLRSGELGSGLDCVASFPEHTSSAALSRSKVFPISAPVGLDGRTAHSVPSPSLCHIPRVCDSFFKRKTALLPL